MSALQLDSATQSDEGVSRPPRTLDDLCERIRKYYPHGDLDLIKRAYEVSEKAHAGQIRRSGEPYFSHPLSVAAILAELHMDLPTIATGLLHDTVEDTPLTLDEIRKEFGPTVANLVDGVTKISQMRFRNTVEKQGENVRKMIVAMGKDVRVVLVKLADRLHNMRTLNHMSVEKQARIAQETLDIYAPLASRLGISSVKIELEDLSFRYLKPDKYYDLVQRINAERKERDKYIEETKRVLVGELQKRSQVRFEVSGRPKHLYSIYRKMSVRDIDFDDVHDMLAFRVVVGTVSECYEVLGHVHALWKPIPGRFKDFIAMPKANNYQSLHTTVIGPEGERVEIQIRTQEMHLVAEKGIAAHWQYKENSEGDESSVQKFNWLRELVALHQQTGRSEEFLDNVKTDLFGSEIYVFTPRGDVKELPEGATPLDFAYAVHTDVGHKTVAARVNGKIVPLKYRLKSGDSIEILTSNNQKPSKDWLKFCVTSRAKSKIRAFVTTEQRKRAIEMGRELLEREFRKFGLAFQKQLSTPTFEKVIKDFHLNDAEELFARVTYGKVNATEVAQRFAPERAPEAEKKESSFLEKVFRSATLRSRKTNSVIHVDGLSDVLVRFGKCCSPIPGDPIVGFISRGRGITVHKADCHRIFEMDQGRRVDVEWNKSALGEGAVAERVARLRVISQDVPGLLKSMTETFAANGINIQNAQARTSKDKRAVCTFDVTVRDALQLQRVIQQLEKIRGVLDVARISD